MQNYIHQPPRLRARRPWRYESLEQRDLLHGGGISALLTVSYAPDTTDISGQPSSLHSTFSHLGTDKQWQSAITDAFHQWAKHTNADIGVVDDFGDPFGTPEGTSQFGDIRIGAAPLADSVMAISLPSDNLALGSWASDIIFNSRVDWTSLEQLASVALHEAGHIFGLEHTDDPTSVMHVHGVSEITSPSAADIANLQFLYGERNLDNNELTQRNDSVEVSTDLSTNLAEEMLSLLYGDISSRDDVDFYRITAGDEIEGAVRIVVDNGGVSTADFVVKLYDDDGELLEEQHERDVTGAFTLDYEFDDAEEFFVSVELSENSSVDSGGYFVAVSLDPEELEDDDDNDEYDDLDDDELRAVGDEVRGLLLANGDFLFNEDFADDDDLETANQITPRSFNAGRTWYEQVGSISGEDIDYFRLQSPEDEVGLQNVMTVRVQAITGLALAPRVRVVDELGRELNAQIIRSGNGEHIVQVADVAPETDMFIEVAAEDPNGRASRGNYQLSVNFGAEVVEMTRFADGVLSQTQPAQYHQLFVATPQLFHFLLSASESAAANAPAVRMELFDSAGTVVHSLNVEPGQTRSSQNPLLPPGAYTLRVSFESEPTVGTELSYQLEGFAVSNPLGVVPVDPTAEPIYQCDGVSDQFCYPGGTTSDSPFFWDEFIRNYLDEKLKEQDQQSGSTNPAIDWWEWFWLDSTHTGASKPAPTTGTDSFRVYDQPLIVNHADGLLKNDTNTSSAPMIVRMVETPRHGTLNLNAEGGFRYTPDVDFWGTDTFLYEAFGFDSNAWSSTTSVEIHVNAGGDANSDGEVNFTDFLEFSRSFGSEQTGWHTGDFDGNGATDFTDFLILAGNFGRSAAIVVPPRALHDGKR